MKKKYRLVCPLFVVALMCMAEPANAQNVSVVSAMGTDPETFIKSHFVGEGVHVFNVRFNNAQGNIGTPQIGVYNANGYGALSSTSGIALTTGDLNVLPGPNDRGNAGMTVDGYYSDPEMEALATGTVVGCATLDFDFVSLTEHVMFNYSFGSEEYPEFVGSAFNDVFALLISGIDPYTLTDRTWNMAIIPNTISAEHPNGIAVAINSVNPGMPGANGSWSTGYYDYSGHYYDNQDSAGIQYDGFTQKMVAETDILPCQVYHMHISVCNVGDNALDSGVMLEGNSFCSPLAYIGFSRDGRDTIRQGCPKEIPLTLEETQFDQAVIHLSFGGNAVNGSDYICRSDRGHLIDSLCDSMEISNLRHYFTLQGLAEADLTEPKQLEVYLATAPCADFPDLVVRDTIRFVLMKNNVVRLRDTVIEAVNVCWQVGVELEEGVPPLAFEWIPPHGIEHPHKQYSAAMIHETTNYQVVATDTKGCASDTAQVTVNILEELGVEAIVGEGVKVYPNPMNDKLNINCEGRATIEVFDAKGRRVMSQTHAGGTAVINTQQWEEGLYMVVVTEATRKTVQQVLKIGR